MSREKKGTGGITRWLKAFFQKLSNTELVYGTNSKTKRANALGCIWIYWI